jgi:hypothetical protein
VYSIRSRLNRSFPEEGNVRAALIPEADGA